MKVTSEIIKDMVKFEKEHKPLLTGYPSIDRKNDFLYIGKASMIVGRPCMGKTLFALNLAARIAAQNHKVCYISLAESVTNLTERLLKADIDNGLELVYFDDTPYGEFGVRNMIKKVKSECPDAELIVIDYIQLLGLQSMQWLYDAFPNAALLVLSEASRSVEARENHIVQLDDISNISKIENYFETIFSLYRNDYYNTNDEPTNIMNVIHLKSRLERISYSFYTDRNVVREIEPPEEDIVD